MRKYQALWLALTALVTGIWWGLAINNPLHYLLLPVFFVVGFWAENIDTKLKGV